MAQHLLTYIFLFAVAALAGGASVAATDDPALYKSGRFLIPTLESLQAHALKKHPSLTQNIQYFKSLSYKGDVFPGMTLHVQGIKSGTKVDQKTTYAEILPGLWRLVLVNSQICVRGEALDENKEWVENWMCDEEVFPLSGYHYLFVVSNDSVAREDIQSAFSKPVVDYLGEVTPKAQALMSLGDMQKHLAGLGSTMRVEEADYKSPFEEESLSPVAAIIVYVEGELADEKKVDQSFTYVVDGDELKLKEIDGVVCYHVERVGKEICEPVYTPTPVSPMPLKLLNHHKITGAVPPGPKSGNPLLKKTVPQELQCGPLQGHLTTILKMHFERSLFDANNPVEYDRFLKVFPQVADPLGIVLSNQDKIDFRQNLISRPGYQKQLQKLAQEFHKGKNGDCSFLVNLMKDLRDQALLGSGEVFAVLRKLEENEFDLESLQKQQALWPEHHQKIFSDLNSLVDAKAQANNKNKALDLVAGKISQYLQRSLARLNQLEEFVVAAMAKQDAYSFLLSEVSQVNASLHGISEKKYFGVAVATGLSGRHYFTKLHPKAASQGLEYADEIVTINGIDGLSLTSSQLDQVFLDTNSSIELVVKREGELHAVNLRAQPINPLRLTYKVSREQKGSQDIVRVVVASFEAGVTELIKQDMDRLLVDGPVDGFVLDLRNNPGGNTDEAVNVMSLFVRDRVVSYYRLGSRNLAELKAYNAKPEYFVDDKKPLVVLVNSQTMSSSEIVASGLQALQRSITVGEPTYGKLVGQFYSPLTLSNHKNVGLLLTAFEFYNVNGKALNGIGVIPDWPTSELKVAAIDDGIGYGVDLDPKDLQDVQYYSFSLDDIKQWDFLF